MQRLLWSTFLCRTSVSVLRQGSAQKLKGKIHAVERFYEFDLTGAWFSRYNWEARSVWVSVCKRKGEGDLLLVSGDRTEGYFKLGLILL